jgi:two-component system chemotaxis sensor kinase CheA
VSRFDRLARLAGEFGALSAQFAPIREARQPVERSFELPPEPEAMVAPPLAPDHARLQAFIVECGGVHMAISARNVLEIIAKPRIDNADGGLVATVRGRALPVAPLARLLKLGVAADARADAALLVARVGETVFGLLVDRTFGPEAIEVEPRALSPMFSGAALLPDGAAIVFVNMKAAAAQMRALRAEEPPKARARKDSATRVALLVFRGLGGAMQAAPLSLVQRIEPVEEGEGESALPAVQSDGAPVKPAAGQQLLVFARDGREVGLVAEEVFEVVESFTDAPLQQAGAAGGLMLNGCATELVDVNQLFDAIETPAPAQGGRVLALDQGSFSDVALAPLLAEAGYELVIETAPEAALRRAERGERFDHILVDASQAEIWLSVLRRARAWRGTPVLGFEPEDFDAEALLAGLAGAEFHDL